MNLTNESKIVVNERAYKVADLINYLSCLSGMEVAEFFSYIDFKLPKAIKIRALKDTLLEPVLELRRSKLTVADERKYRLTWFQTFSEFQLENLLEYFNDRDLNLKYLRKLWINILNYMIEQKISDQNFLRLINIATNTEQKIPLNFLRYNLILNKVFIDEKRHLDGLSIDNFRTVLYKSSTIKELRALGEKYDIKVPQRLKKDEFIYLIIKALKENHIYEEGVEKKLAVLRIPELQRFCVKKKIVVSPDLNKAFIIEYILSNAKETKGIYNKPSSDAVYTLEVDDIIKDNIIIEAEERGIENINLDGKIDYQELDRLTKQQQEELERKEAELEAERKRLEAKEKALMAEEEKRRTLGELKEYEKELASLREQKKEAENQLKAFAHPSTIPSDSIYDEQEARQQKEFAEKLRIEKQALEDAKREQEIEAERKRHELELEQEKRKKEIELETERRRREIELEAEHRQKELEIAEEKRRQAEELARVRKQKELELEEKRIRQEEELARVRREREIEIEEAKRRQEEELERVRQEREFELEEARRRQEEELERVRKVRELELEEALRKQEEELLEVRRRKEQELEIEKMRHAEELEKARRIKELELEEAKRRQAEELEKARRIKEIELEEEKRRQAEEIEKARKLREFELEEAKKRHEVELEKARRERELELEVEKRRQLEEFEKAKKLREFELEEARRRQEVEFEKARRERELELAEAKRRQEEELEKIRIQKQLEFEIERRRQEEELEKVRKQREYELAELNKQKAEELAKLRSYTFVHTTRHEEEELRRIRKQRELELAELRRRQEEEIEEARRQRDFEIEYARRRREELLRDQDLRHVRELQELNKQREEIARFNYERDKDVRYVQVQYAPIYETIRRQKELELEEARKKQDTQLEIFNLQKEKELAEQEKTFAELKKQKEFEIAEARKKHELEIAELNNKKELELLEQAKAIEDLKHQREIELAQQAHHLELIKKEKEAELLKQTESLELVKKESEKELARQNALIEEIRKQQMAKNQFISDQKAQELETKEKELAQIAKHQAEELAAKEAQLEALNKQKEIILLEHEKQLEQLKFKRSLEIEEQDQTLEEIKRQKELEIEKARLSKELELVAINQAKEQELAAQAKSIDELKRLQEEELKKYNDQLEELKRQKEKEIEEAINASRLQKEAELAENEKAFEDEKHRREAEIEEERHRHEAELEEARRRKEAELLELERQQEEEFNKHNIAVKNQKTNECGEKLSDLKNDIFNFAIEIKALGNDVASFVENRSEGDFDELLKVIKNELSSATPKLQEYKKELTNIIFEYAKIIEENFEDLKDLLNDKLYQLKEDIEEYNRLLDQSAAIRKENEQNAVQVIDNTAFKEQKLTQVLNEFNSLKTRIFDLESEFKGFEYQAKDIVSNEDLDEFRKNREDIIINIEHHNNEINATKKELTAFYFENGGFFDDTLNSLYELLTAKVASVKSSLEDLRMLVQRLDNKETQLKMEMDNAVKEAAMAEEMARQEQHAEEIRKQHDDELARKEQEAEELRKQLDEELARKEQEAEELRKQHEAELARKEQEAEELKKQLDAKVQEEIRKQHEEELARKDQEAEELRKQLDAKLAEELARKDQEAEELRKQREADLAQELARKDQETEELRKQLDAKLAEELARKEQEAEELKKQHDAALADELARKEQEAEELRKEHEIYLANQLAQQDSDADEIRKQREAEFAEELARKEQEAEELRKQLDAKLADDLARKDQEAEELRRQRDAELAEELARKEREARELLDQKEIELAEELARKEREAQAMNELEEAKRIALQQEKIKACTEELNRLADEVDGFAKERDAKILQLDEFYATELTSEEQLPELKLKHAGFHTDLEQLANILKTHKKDYENIAFEYSSLDNEELNILREGIKNKLYELKNLLDQDEQKLDEFLLNAKAVLNDLSLSQKSEEEQAKHEEFLRTQIGGALQALTQLADEVDRHGNSIDNNITVPINDLSQQIKAGNEIENLEQQIARLEQEISTSGDILKQYKKAFDNLLFEYSSIENDEIIAIKDSLKNKLFDLKELLDKKETELSALKVKPGKDTETANLAPSSAVVEEDDSKAEELRQKKIKACIDEFYKLADNLDDFSNQYNQKIQEIQPLYQTELTSEEQLPELKAQHLAFRNDFDALNEYLKGHKKVYENLSFDYSSLESDELNALRDSIKNKLYDLKNLLGQEEQKLDDFILNAKDTLENLSLSQKSEEDQGKREEFLRAQLGNALMALNDLADKVDQNALEIDSNIVTPSENLNTQVATEEEYNQLADTVNNISQEIVNASEKLKENKKVFDDLVFEYSNIDNAEVVALKEGLKTKLYDLKELLASKEIELSNILSSVRDALNQNNQVNVEQQVAPEAQPAQDGPIILSVDQQPLSQDELPILETVVEETNFSQNEKMKEEKREQDVLNTEKPVHENDIIEEAQPEIKSSADELDDLLKPISVNPFALEAFENPFEIETIKPDDVEVIEEPKKKKHPKKEEKNDELLKEYYAQTQKMTKAQKAQLNKARAQGKPVQVKPTIQVASKVKPKKRPRYTKGQKFLILIITLACVAVVATVAILTLFIKK